MRSVTDRIVHASCITEVSQLRTQQNRNHQTMNQYRSDVGQRRRRYPSIKTTLAQRLVFAANSDELFFSLQMKLISLVVHVYVIQCHVLRLCHAMSHYAMLCYF